MEATPRPLEAIVEDLKTVLNEGKPVGQIIQELMTAARGSRLKQLDTIHILTKAIELITLQMVIMEKEPEKKEEEDEISFSDSTKEETKKEEEEEDPNELKDLPEEYDRSKVLFWVQTRNGPRLFADRNRKPEKHGAIIGWFYFKKNTAMEVRIDVCRNSKFQMDFEHETLKALNEFDNINEYIINNFEVEDFSPENL